MRRTLRVGRFLEAASFIGALLALGSLVPTASRAQATPFTDSMTLNGTAVVTATGLRLTDAAGNEAGSAWETSAQSLSSDLHVQFVFSFHDSTSGVPADGLAFVIQNDSRRTAALGSAGGYLGYGGITPSIAVEFDDYLNGWDPDANHIAIDTNGNMTNSPSVDPAFSLYGSGSIYAWVDYSGASNALNVFVAQTSTKPSSPLLTYNVNLTTAVGPTGYVGLTAATGAYNQITDVSQFELAGSSPGLPGAPQNVSVSLLHNGFADVSWQPPTSTGSSPIQSYTAMATPVYNDRYTCSGSGSGCTKLPPPPTLTITCPGSLQCNSNSGSPPTSVIFVNLLADCHQMYQFSVFATNAAGNGLSASSASYRPSGIVDSGQAPLFSEPPSVVVLLDGIAEWKSGFTMNPYAPTPPEPTLNNMSGYCPEEWNASASAEAEANFNGPPSGPWEFFNKWNFADPNGPNTDPSLPCTDTSGNASPAKCSNSTPRDLGTGATTHAFMLDAIAAQGGIILPYSYKGATVTGSSANPTFTFPGYSACDSTPSPVPTPPSAPSCSGRQSIDEDIHALDKEISSIQTVWKDTPIVLLGHSQGGLIAWEWMRHHGLENASGVVKVFTLDSPINGVCSTIFCFGPTSYPNYGQRVHHGTDYLRAEAAAGNPARFIGTQGDTVPVFPLVGAYGPSGFENLQHELLVTGDNCSYGGNQSDCPSPPDHVSGCDIDTHSQYANTQWIQDDQHFIEKFCPDDVAYFNGTLGLQY